MGTWRHPQAGDWGPESRQESKTGAVWDVDFKLSGISDLFKNQLGKYL